MALLSLITMRWLSIEGTNILLPIIVVVVPPPLIKGIVVRRISIVSLLILISHVILFFLGTTKYEALITWTTTSTKSAT